MTATFDPHTGLITWGTRTWTPSEWVAQRAAANTEAGTYGDPEHLAKRDLMRLFGPEAFALLQTEASR